MLSATLYSLPRALSLIPFTKTLLLGFEFGIATNCKWTVFVDADVLPFENGFFNLCRYAEQMSEKRAVIQGLIFDKFL